MDTNRRSWNDRQKALRQALTKPEYDPQAMDLFLEQHAMLHSEAMSHAGLWSFEDEVLDGIAEDQMRIIPGGCDHSIAWTIWHMTRIEDVTMNLLLAGSPQIMTSGNWLDRMQIDVVHTGNSMPANGVIRLSAAINLPALRAYRLAVGQRTRQVASQLQPAALHQKVDPCRLETVRREGAVLPEAVDLLDYWGGLTLAGLLLMPPTRHNLVHWNEALRIKQKLK